jgi:peptidoglycan/xylan/chitin deacetylase (PgdA/CDA1 family)
MYIPNSPFWLQWLYPSVLWHKSREEKSVYISFDDGPIPVVTPFVLNTLNRFNAKATFFCIGDNIAKNPEIFQQVIDEGHAIGNHTFNHLNGWKSADEEYLTNIRQAQELTGTNLFRPPYGRIKKSQIKKLKSAFPGTQIIMWDVLSGDFDSTIGAQTCINNVLKHAKNGSIIVFHDSLKAFPRLEKALPVVLEELSAKGYSFRALGLT